MKAEKIKAILYTQTGGVYSEDWYNETVKMIKPTERSMDMTKKLSDLEVILMEKINSFERDVRISPKDVFNELKLENVSQRFLTKCILDLCQENNIPFKRGKTMGTRWFSILSLK